METKKTELDSLREIESRFMKLLDKCNDARKDKDLPYSIRNEYSYIGIAYSQCLQIVQEYLPKA